MDDPSGKSRLKVLAVFLLILCISYIPAYIGRLVIGRYSLVSFILLLLSAGLMSLCPFVAAKWKPYLAGFDKTWLPAKRVHFIWSVVLFAVLLAWYTVFWFLSTRFGLWPDSETPIWKIVGPPSRWSILIYAILSIVIGPITEEIFWRGYSQEQFAKVFPKSLALFLQAALFSLVHLRPIALSVLLFGDGLIFGYWRLKKRSLLPIIVAHIMFNTLCYASWYCNDYTQAKSEIILSHETTRISEPLNPDGTVNYLAALNNQYSQGVTPENNAAVLLIQAGGPDVLPQGFIKEMLSGLGISALPETGDYFIFLHGYTNGSEEIDDILELARHYPWSARQYPQLAAWLKANQAPLELVTKAANRSRYYVPLISDDHPPRIHSAFPYTLHSQQMAEALVARAMLNLNDGNIDAAWDDLLAVHRLARLVGQGSNLIERLVGMALESAACGGDNALATNGRLTLDQAKAYLSDLQALSVLPGVVEPIDTCERFANLDGIMNLYRTGCKNNFMALFDMDPSPKRTFEADTNIDLSKIDKEKAAQVPELDIDWNEILRMMNSRQDRVLNAARKGTFAERMQAFDQLSSQLRALQNDATKHMQTVLGIQADAHSSVDIESLSEQATQALPNLLIGMWCAELSGAVALYDQATMNLQASRVAMALAAYRAEYGTYPRKLVQLSPQYIKTVPEDFFTVRPLDYRRIGKGYRLYSPGPTRYKRFRKCPLDIRITADE